MSIEKTNAEGYPDPTAHMALTNILKEQNITGRIYPYMPKVFICSPFAGETARNTASARRYCAFAAALNRIPFAPHIFFSQFMDDDDPEQRDLCIFMGTVFLDSCREVWVFGSSISRGMATEIAHANRRGIPVRYFTDQCEEVQPDV
jgi:hypothetical protein